LNGTPLEADVGETSKHGKLILRELKLLFPQVKLFNCRIKKDSFTYITTAFNSRKPSKAKDCHREPNYENVSAISSHTEESFS
jgi:hypothetical protein